MTYITKRCKNCGFSHKASVYGYVHDPIGSPYCICPTCRTVQRDKSSKEWIQMSPYKKFRAIHPRGTASCFFLWIVLMVFIVLIFETIVPASVRESLEFLKGLLLLPSYFLALYLVTIIKVNGETFRKRLCSSILRTRNSEYRQLLEQDGKIYGESIPGWILCSKSSKKLIEEYLENNAPTDLSLPTIPQTVRNT